jgi:hypothetical protein
VQEAYKNAPGLAKLLPGIKEIVLAYNSNANYETTSDNARYPTIQPQSVRDYAKSILLKYSSFE